MPDTYIHIGEMLARNARNYGEEIALVERTPAIGLRNEITWQQFDEKANRLANALSQKGINKESKVMHLMHNSIDWLVAYFGIIRTGALVVPLNFRFTSSEIEYCVNATEPDLLLFAEEFRERVEAVKNNQFIKHYICIGDEIPEFAESFVELIESAAAIPPDIFLTYSDPSALYFTSGTTGKPKPILLTHKNLVCAGITEKVHHGQKKEDNFILIPPLYHTGAKMHWFGSLIVGSRSVILKGLSPEWILEAISEEGGTIVWLLVPWVLDILVKLDQGELSLDDYKLDQLRLMHMGAMPIPPSLIKRWRKYFPWMEYNTTYGLTETTGPNCMNLGIENMHKVGAIGRPGFNWDARIVDEHEKNVARGDAGELILRGDGIMREYYKNPEATARALKDGWFYTGDIARQDEDGFFYLVDRKKDVIICGGENVFPVEVEDFIHLHPKVKDAAVIGFPDERLGEIVAAVIELVPGQTLSQEEVLEYCLELPRYKRPRKVFFGEIARSPTGKIEKPKLRDKFSHLKKEIQWLKLESSGDQV